MACACVALDGWAKIAAVSSSHQARHHQLLPKVCQVPVALVAVVEAVLVVAVADQALLAWAAQGTLPLTQKVPQEARLGRRVDRVETVEVARPLCLPELRVEWFAEKVDSAQAMENATLRLPSVSVCPHSSGRSVRGSVVPGSPKLEPTAPAMACVKWACVNVLQGGEWPQAH